MSKSVSRGLSVGIVTLGYVIVIVAFVIVAVPPIVHEFHVLVTNYPRYKANLIAGRGSGSAVDPQTPSHWLSEWQVETETPCGRRHPWCRPGTPLRRSGHRECRCLDDLLLHRATRHQEAVVVVDRPQSAVSGSDCLTDEVFDRVGGFMLGNLLTSVVSAVGTYVWLVIFDVPYALLLALVVGVFDLIPMVGSTIAGVIVSLVALSKGLPTGVATAGFYISYRFLEDYLLNPRVMKHTVKVTPGLTIIATLIGRSLLGIIGALIAIPIAATIHLLLQEVCIPEAEPAMTGPAIVSACEGRVATSARAPKHRRQAGAHATRDELLISPR